MNQKAHAIIPTFSESSQSSNEVFGRNVAVQAWLLLLYYSQCHVGRGSRDNPQTGAEVRNVLEKLSLRYVS